MTLTVTEPRTYCEDSPHHYVLDLAAVSTLNHPGCRAAQDRLDQHYREVAHEITQKSSEGLRAERQIRESLRVADASEHRRAVESEIRAMTAGAGSGGNFVTPVYLAEHWAAALDVEPVLAAQSLNVPLPSYGLVANVPTFTSGSTAAIQESSAGTGEGSLIDLDNPDPVAGYRQAPVETVSTGVLLSQQLVDRGGPVVSFDQALAAQLALNVNAQIDGLVWSQIQSAGTTTAGGGPASAGALYGDVASARERAYAPGTRVRPTHLFTDDTTFSWFSRQMDSTGRPIMAPQYAPDVPPWGLTGERDDGHWSGFTGVVLPGALMWFVDESVGASLLVSRPSTVLLAQGDPVFRVVTDGSYAGSLQAVAELYQYVACMPLVPGANQIVSGYGSAR